MNGQISVQIAIAVVNGYKIMVADKKQDLLTSFF